MSSRIVVIICLFKLFVITFNKWMTKVIFILSFVWVWNCTFILQRIPTDLAILLSIVWRFRMEKKNEKYFRIEIGCIVSLQNEKEKEMKMEWGEFNENAMERESVISMYINCLHFEWVLYSACGFECIAFVFVIVTNRVHLLKICVFLFLFFFLLSIFQSLVAYARGFVIVYFLCADSLS